MPKVTGYDCGPVANMGNSTIQQSSSLMSRDLFLDLGITSLLSMMSDTRRKERMLKFNVPSLALDLAKLHEARQHGYWNISLLSWALA
jgi:hypothetical protein